MSVVRAAEFIDQRVTINGVPTLRGRTMTAAGQVGEEDRIAKGSFFLDPRTTIKGVPSLRMRTPAGDGAEVRAMGAYLDAFGVRRWRAGEGLPSCFRDFAGGVYVPCALGWTWPAVIAHQNGNVIFRYCVSFSIGLPLPSYCAAYGGQFQPHETVAFGYNSEISAGSIFVYDQGPDIGWPEAARPRVELHVQTVGQDALQVTLLRLKPSVAYLNETIPPLDCLSTSVEAGFGEFFDATDPFVVPRGPDGAFHVDAAWPANGVAVRYAPNVVPGITIQPAAAPSIYDDDPPELTFVSRGYSRNTAIPFANCDVGSGACLEGSTTHTHLWGTEIF